MSKLEELIQRYCPDGVEYKPLGEICKPLHKGTLTTKELVEPNGSNYPVINSGRELYGYYPQFNNEGDAFTVAARGEYAGYITYFSERFWAGGLCYPYRSNSPVILTKFVFYCLKTKQEYIRHTLVAEGSIPALNKGTLDLFEIPITPLPVQEEIVRVLDTFTELQAELQAELQKRLQQYNYYRDNLLSFDGRTDVEWKKLGEISKVCRGVRVVKSQLSNEGYPVYQNCLTPMGYYDKTNCPAGTPFVICGGAAGNVGYADVDWWAADDCEYIIGNVGLTNRYIYHCLMAKKDYLLSQVRKASIPRLSPSVIKDLEIPLPSLEEQERIASILDRFDSLTTDLTAGLPAEIEKRKLQYEYYRDKLLTFKRK